jgi:hypothetical protein
MEEVLILRCALSIDAALLVVKVMARALCGEVGFVHGIAIEEVDAGFTMIEPNDGVIVLHIDPRDVKPASLRAKSFQSLVADEPWHKPIGMSLASDREMADYLSGTMRPSTISALTRVNPCKFASHQFEAVVPLQFNESIWINSTKAVLPFDVAELQGLPDAYRFGL